MNFLKVGQCASAIDQFLAACGKADADPDIKPQRKARARYDLCGALWYSGSYDEGIRELERAVQIQPEETYVREIRRIKSLRSDAERLRQQGVETAPTTRLTIVVAG